LAMPHSMRIKFCHLKLPSRIDFVSPNSSCHYLNLLTNNLSIERSPVSFRPTSPFPIISLSTSHYNRHTLSRVHWQHFENRNTKYTWIIHYFALLNVGNINCDFIFDIPKTYLWKWLILCPTLTRFFLCNNSLVLLARLLALIPEKFALNEVFQRLSQSLCEIQKLKIF
jgi:hypothetical protein